MKTQTFPLTIENDAHKTNLPQFTQYSQLLPSTGGDDLTMTRVKTDTMVRLANLEVDAIRVQEDAKAQIAQIQANAVISVENARARVSTYHDYTVMEIERIQAHSREVSHLIAATSANMSQALQSYKDFPGSYEVTVKHKLGWFKSSKMTVKAESYPIFYHRGPSR